jgi:hypothetical protein
VRMEYKYCPNLSIIDTPGEALAVMGKLMEQGANLLLRPYAALSCMLPGRDVMPAALRRFAGLISAAPGKRNGQLQASARQVLCRTQLACPHPEPSSTVKHAAVGRTRRHQCLLYIQCENSCKTLQLQVEGMVRAKMEQKEYIILCLEDSNDWSNATTRRLVMQACFPSCCGQAAARRCRLAVRAPTTSSTWQGANSVAATARCRRD